MQPGRFVIRVALVPLASLVLLGASCTPDFVGLEEPFICPSARPAVADPLGHTTEELTYLPRHTEFFRRLEPCVGWARQVRDELIDTPPGPAAGEPRHLLSLVHLSDIHIIDAESPLRIEFLRHRRGFELPDAEFQAAFRPQETMTAQVTEAMVRQINNLGSGPVTGRDFDLAISTGDSGDNHQDNELERMIALLNGGMVTPYSGSGSYEGVQDDHPSPLFCQFWHPDPARGDERSAEDHDVCLPCDNDTRKTCDGDPRFGANKWSLCQCFPDYPRLLDHVVRPFKATGLIKANGRKLPWYVTYGNHDRLLQGNFPIRPGRHRTDALETIATGGSKLLELPEHFRADEPLEQKGLVDLFLFEFLNPFDSNLDMRPFLERWRSGPSRSISADPQRHLWSDREFMQKLLKNPHEQHPPGHGFGPKNLASGNLYYTFDLTTEDPLTIRGIVLDTTNPGGLSGGSIDRPQFKWLETQLQAAHTSYYDVDGELRETGNSEDRLVVIFSHHDSTTLDNTFPVPGLLSDRAKAEELEGLLHRYPNAILWLNGHTHYPRVFAHRDPTDRTPGFWEVNTPSLIDFPQMARLVELVDNNNGSLSIYATLIDHGGPANPKNATEPLLRLASISRELAVNDPLLDMSNQIGWPKDRNVELLIESPLDRP